MGRGAGAGREPLVSAPTRFRRLNWKALLGLAISALFLYLALRGIDARLVLRHIASADPWLFLGSVVAVSSVFWIRAWRWRSLIRPVYPDTHFRNRFPAVAIGFMAMNLLPARAGEFVRAYVLSRREPVPLAASLGSLVVEHLFDGLCLVAITFAVLAFPGFPAESPAARTLHHTAALLGLVFGGIAVVLLALVVWPRPMVALAERLVARLLPPAWGRRIVDALESVLAALRVIREPLLLARVVAWTVLLWLVGAVSYWLGALAFGIHVPFLGGLFLQSVVAFAVALPSSPGFVGVFEAAVRFGLVEIWNVDANRAVSYAIGFHLGGYIPVTLIGLFYVWRLGMSWGEMGRGEQAVDGSPSDVAPDAPAAAASTGSAE